MASPSILTKKRRARRKRIAVRERQGLLLLGVALLIAIFYHGVLNFNRHFVHTYDALIHIFIGANYQDNWFDPWEPRWYTGFFVVQYPPLSHYLIAIFGTLFKNLLTGFALAQTLAIMQLTVGVYRLTKLLFSPRAAGYAALSLVLSSAIAETVHVFGQLPTTLSLGFLLNGIPFIIEWVRKGRTTDLIRAVAWTAATTAAHHVTTLFGSVFFTAPMIVIALLEGFRAERANEPQGNGFIQKAKRRGYRLLPRFYRSGIFGVLAIASLLIVVFPYWFSSFTDPITQVSIPHGSRANFLVRRDLGLMFWVIPWASSLWVFPYAMARGFLTWRWPAAASILLLAFLGTGGTTPGPRLLLGGAFDILTLDRFTFWSTMFILPFMGRALESLIHGKLGHYIKANFGQRVLYILLAGLLAVIASSALWISTLTQYRKFQPDPINIDPIINFINKDEHWKWRYLNLGFGDQMAWLSANTKASTPDGNYHSARRLPELTTTPIERLEGAKYTGAPGIGSLEQILVMPEKYNVKYIYANDAFYDPLLFFNGWHRLGLLENGIMVWEREGIPPLPDRVPRKTWPLYQRLMWGILPLIMPVLAYLSLLLPKWRIPVMPWQKRGLGAWALGMLKEDVTHLAAPSQWQWWSRYKNLTNKVNFERRSLRFRLLSTSLLFFILIAPVVYGYWYNKKINDTPEKAVLAYWDHLDFKRFEDAYTWLEPIKGLDFDRWLLDFSVVGGLRSGYAKLETIDTVLLGYEGEGSKQRPKLGDRAFVRANLDWLTSLTAIQESIDHELVRVKGGWRILAEPSVKARAQERFIGQTSIDYYRSPRRLTIDLQDINDTLDYPIVEILNARLVSYEVEKTDLELEAEGVFNHDLAALPMEERELTAKRFSVVGELQNFDSRPADITITALLRDAQGNELSRANAGQLVLHKLLPGERTPFRIDFDDVAKVDFIVDQVASFEVFPKAVVTGRNLERDLAIWSEVQDNALQIRAVNLGAKEAGIPHALISLFDDNGLAWVNESYVMESIPPKEAREFIAELSVPESYTLEQSFINKDLTPEDWPLFDLKHDLFSHYRVQMHAFYRD